MNEFLLITGLYTVCTLLCTALVFLLARVLRDNSIMDVAYGAIFVVAAWTTVLYFDVTPQTYALLALVTLWGIRLTLRILRKNWGKPEDPRYAAWRNQWMQRGMLYFWLRSYLQINLLQGLIIVLISLPLIASLSVATIINPYLFVIGISISIFGLLYESTADWQLDKFLARKKAGTENAILMTTGLFQYSRRPNYFGETLVWWGQALAVAGINWQLVVFIAPITITYVVARITGPMLERIFLEKYPVQYGAYMRHTNYLIPSRKSTNVEKQP